jgi:hypothetical protein
MVGLFGDMVGEPDLVYMAGASMGDGTVQRSPGVDVDNI